MADLFRTGAKFTADSIYDNALGKGQDALNASGLRFYTVADLGLSLATATTTAIIQALPANAVLLQTLTSGTSAKISDETGIAAGLVMIVKQGSSRATGIATVYNASVFKMLAVGANGEAAWGERQDFNAFSALSDGSVAFGSGISTGGPLQRTIQTLGDNTAFYITMFYDGNGDSRGGLQLRRVGDNEGLRLLTVRTVNGSQIINGLTLYLDPAGNASVAVSSPAAWRSALALDTWAAALGYVKPYQVGDSVSFGSNTYARFVGDWRGSTQLFFTIPLSKPCVGLTPTLTGKFAVLSNGARTSDVTIDGSTVRADCYVSAAGVSVWITFNPAADFVQYQHVVSIQPQGLTITFS